MVIMCVFMLACLLACLQQQHRKQHRSQQQLLQQQQQPDCSGAPTTRSTSNDDHRAGAQLHPGQEWRDRPERARLKPCWDCDTRNRGPSGPLGVVLTSPPAVLGGPVKTGSVLPVLGEVKDSDVSVNSILVLLRPRPLRHDFVIFG
jgi:hypothetical protein